MAFVEIDSAGIFPLRVFHIVQNKGFVLLFLSLIAFGILCPLTSFKVCKLDTVSFLLFLKALLDFMHFVINPGIGNTAYWYFYSMVFVMPFIYMIFRSYSGDLRQIIKIINVFAIIIVFQELITANVNGIPYNMQEYKMYMRIPVAHSNIIGVILLAILILNIKLHEINYKTLLVDGIILLGIFLTQSRGCLIFLIAWLCFIKLQSYYRKYGMTAAFVIALIMLSGLALLIYEIPALQTLLFEVSIQNQYLMSTATSGRTDIWELAWNQWFTNPLWGSGLGVTEYDIGKEVITTGVHNIVLDYAVQSGLVGVVLYFVAVFKGMKSKMIKKVAFYSAIKLSLIVMLVYSLFEVTYFNYSCFFIFWMMMGFYNSKQLFYELHIKHINTNKK